MGNGKNGHGSNRINQKAFLFYYHPDHLGSSSYLTDTNGEVYQRIEYFPFGETFLEEHSNTDRTPYLFNGKELDEETQLYYYGARYYDAKTSVWQSVDPPIINGHYLNGSHDGGVYNSFNLGAYMYCRQNPVIYTDPDGNQYITRYIYYNSNGNINHNKSYDILHYKSSGKLWIGQGWRSRLNPSSNPGIRYVHRYADGSEDIKWGMNGIFPTDHGIYSGSGAVKKRNMTEDDFTFQPLDIADAIAKQHDRDYISQGYDSSIGVVNDYNTLQADTDMVERVKKAILGSDSEALGIDKPVTERILVKNLTGNALTGQLGVISLLRDFKQWKLDNGYLRGDSILDKKVYKAYKADVGIVKAYATKAIGKATQPE